MNRQVITAGDLDLYIMDYRLRKPSAWEEPIADLRRRVLSTAVDDFLLGGWADIQLENPVPQEMVEASYRTAWQHDEEMAGGADQLIEMLKDSKINEQNFRTWVKNKSRENLTIREVVIGRADLGGKNPFDGKVTDAVRMKISQILVQKRKTEEETLARALRIRRDIEAGLTFEKAVRLYSDDETNSLRGGELGWFDASELNPDLWAAAKSVPVGRCSEPVRTKAGYHLLTVLDFETPEQLDYLRIVEVEEQKQLKVLREKTDFLFADGYNLEPLTKRDDETAQKYRDVGAPADAKD